MQEISEHPIDTPEPAIAPAALGVGDIDDAINDDAWAKPKPRGNRRLSIVATALAVSLFGIGTFTAGAKMAKKSSASSVGSGRAGALAGLAGGAFPGGFGGGNGGFGGAAGGNRGGRTGSGSSAGSGSGATAAGSDALSALLAGTASSGAPAIEGKVTAIDATTITVTRPDGSTAVVTIDSKATFARRTSVPMSQIAVGDNVAAEGTVDTAGNVAATSVTVGDLPVTATDSTATNSAATSATVADQPTPSTGADLGGLLGG